MKKMRIAITGLTACSGCQLALLNCEDELPLLLEHVDFDYFPMACSPSVLRGKYQAALVEGCVSMPGERELLKALRERSKLLVAVGTCAAWGGVATLRNGESRDTLRRIVYGDTDIANQSTEPVPLKEVVPVDFTITGCPPEKIEILELFAALMKGTLPVLARTPVCAECRARENLCLLTEKCRLCLGALTSGGCNARCPSMGVACEGCRGPVEEANVREAMAVFAEKGHPPAKVRERMQRFCREWNDENR